MTQQHLISQIGHAGEDIAERYLSALGHEILCRNYRVKGGEIDLITLSKGILYIVEVKASRFKHRDYSPVERVDVRKLGRLKRAAGKYLSENSHEHHEIRMVIVEVEGTETREPQVTFHDSFI